MGLRQESRRPTDPIVVERELRKDQRYAAGKYLRNIMAVAAIWSVACLVGTQVLPGGQVEATPTVEPTPTQTPLETPIPTPTLLEKAIARLAYFDPAVQYWKDWIVVWNQQFGIPVEAIATIMQIESCGNPWARSRSGAMGLFQVMPFHFASGEDPYDVETNARRGLGYFRYNLDKSGGDLGQAFIGYNGGSSRMFMAIEDLPAETRRYLRWSGMYVNAIEDEYPMPVLEAWYKAGGASLCVKAREQLGIGKAIWPDR